MIGPGKGPTQLDYRRSAHTDKSLFLYFLPAHGYAIIEKIAIALSDALFEDNIAFSSIDIGPDMRGLKVKGVVDTDGAIDEKIKSKIETHFYRIEKEATS